MIGWLAGWLVGWLVASSYYMSVDTNGEDRLDFYGEGTDLLVGWLVGWLVDWLVG